jgi:hypothetical protein
MKLAIVGSTKFEDDPAGIELATELINHYLDRLFVDLVISGGARGIDQLGVRLARERNIDVIEFLPMNNRWEPKGYKDRNLVIAEACDELLRLAHYKSKTYGSGWTADHAESLGKPVHRYTYRGN